MMFSFFKHTLPSGFFQGACDMHCHILPGVDDGFQTTELAVEALQLLERQGVRKMILTPHFMKEYPGNVKASIIEKFKTFKTQVAESVHIELHLAAEHMLDARFLEHFKDGFLTLDEGGSHVLCETSYLMYERNNSEMLYEIMLAGYQPVIAHPERYHYASKGQYERWKEKGYLFQLNILSLAGAYGHSAMVKSHNMLNKGMYDFVGSDMHRIGNFLKFIPKMRLRTKEIEQLRQLLDNNAKLFS